MGSKAISVIIPTYNRCERLGKALDAVCSQSVEEMEVIVVDNNSRDDTAAFVKAYPDPRVKYTLCTQQGCFPALNHGLAQAKGPYLTWTSDDNWYHPGALRDMLTAIETTGADFVYSDYIAYDEGTGQEIVFPAQEATELNRHCCIGPCFLFRRSVYDRLGGYDCRYPLASDYDYWLRIYRAGFRMLRLPSPRYTFTYHETSASGSRDPVIAVEACHIRLAHKCHPRLRVYSELFFHEAYVIGRAGGHRLKAFLYTILSALLWPGRLSTIGPSRRFVRTKNLMYYALGPEAFHSLVDRFRGKKRES